MTAIESMKFSETKQSPSPFARRRIFFSFNIVEGVVITVLLLCNAIVNKPYPIAFGIALSLLIGCSLTLAIVWAAWGFRKFGRPKNSDGRFDSRGDSDRVE